MINRRDTLAALAFAAFAATPARLLSAHHGGQTSEGDEMVLGIAGAPITMIEYSSLTCPGCAEFHADTLPQIMENYIDSGRLRLVYRHFPLDQFALMGAALAECAGRHHFFNFLDALFKSQKTWAGSADPIVALTGIGRLGGLKPEAVAACFDDKALLERILADRINGAEEFAVNSTPTFIINGKKLIGAQPYETFAEIFERLPAD